MDYISDSTDQAKGLETGDKKFQSKSDASNLKADFSSTLQSKEDLEVRNERRVSIENDYSYDLIEDLGDSMHNNLNSSENGEAEQINVASEFNNKRIILQRFTVYNTKTTMYIVGSNAKESLFRVLEILKDPNDDGKIVVIEDKNYFYTRKDMVELINGLSESIEGGIHKIAQGYGLLGLIKFTKEYYLSMITKCSQVAIIGGHFIYHVDETKLIPLDLNYKRPEKYSDEEKLLSIFKYLDLGKTFYFSYAYDITNTLQTNIVRHKKYATEFKFKREGYKRRNLDEYSTFEHNERFVWNKLLLKPILENKDIATYEWFQPIIHGFIDQANISIYGKKIYITIIARRSHHFAGARFLKRGVNDKGNVANEVETEQIVSDMLVSSFHDARHGFYNNPRFTSFVQHRGSIPLYWTQDLNRLPKPPIEINLPDPFYRSSAIHFNNLFQRYGLPIIILNLIKTKEKQPRELKLRQHFNDCIEYLNQFLPQEHKLQYHSFDMSKHSRKHLDVIKPLQKISADSILKIGFFHNGKNLKSTKLQKGIIRTNCIDCLDRTNAAQFIICKEALSHQLSSLGLKAESTSLDYDSDIINILTEIFHDHGDTIAVQYGGSNLVNTMDSYRRINQWSSHTRDILNSIKRIYSNSFMDLIRQEAINLFLGNYQYHPNKPKLWELENDFYLHNDSTIDNIRLKVSYLHWFNDNFLNENRFDLSHNEINEIRLQLEPFPDHNDNWFNECYVPRKLQSMNELFQFNMNSNARYFPTSFNNDPIKKFDYSPFKSRKPYLGAQTENSKDNELSKLGIQSFKYLKNSKQEVKKSNSNEKSHRNAAVYAISSDKSFAHNSFKFDASNRDYEFDAINDSNNYLNLTNPNRLKNFFATKIEKFGYSKIPDKLKRNQHEERGYRSYSDTDLQSFSENQPTHIQDRSWVAPSIELREENAHLYKKQCDMLEYISDLTPSKDVIPSNSFLLSSENRQLYENFTKNTSTQIPNAVESPRNYMSFFKSNIDYQDILLYSKYCGTDTEKLFKLTTEDDYFE